MTIAQFIVARAARIQFEAGDVGLLATVRDYAEAEGLPIEEALRLLKAPPDLEIPAAEPEPPAISVEVTRPAHDPLPLRVQAVMSRIARENSTTAAAVRSKRQTTLIAGARREIARELAGMGFNAAQVARWLNLHHTTVLKQLGRIGRRKNGLGFAPLPQAVSDFNERRAESIDS